jgi:Subtilase family
MLLSEGGSMGGCLLEHGLGAGRSTCLTILIASLFGFVLSQAALAETIRGITIPGQGIRYSPKPLPTEPSTPCPPAKAGAAECEVIVNPRPSVATGVQPAEGGGTEVGGLTPAELQQAYGLTEKIKNGKESTIAVVDAYNDPKANSDLKVYRKEYGLPECTEENKCFTKVDAKGETEKEAETNKAAFPENRAEPSVETSLDIDMVSAACPECHILLVEATEGGAAARGAAEEEAVKWEEVTTKRKSSAITNSWNLGFEKNNPANSKVNCEKQLCVSSEEEAADNHYFDHPGIPIFFSGGDYGYAVRYPAVSQYVIAVGGTTLKKEKEPFKTDRKWTETVWSNPKEEADVKGRGTGSGCSLYEAKPKWQTVSAYKACAHRLQNDVSADADWVNSPVSMYDSYEQAGWETDGGTSASSPFVAGVEGLDSSFVRSLGAEAFYKHPSSLYDITETNDGTCTPPTEDALFCTAEPGYDGPTGWGTPKGTMESTSFTPAAITEPASAVTETSATLHGAINPENLETEYFFEYGPTLSYGSRIPVTNAKLAAGATYSEVNEAVAGLGPETIYHFRLVAKNGDGTTDGEDHTLTTPAPSWAIQSSPKITGALESALFRVSCSSTVACTSVGEYENSASVYVTLAERWNGTEWAIQTTPNPAGAEESYLQGVACTSSTACAAIGGYVNSEAKLGSLAEVWNGTEWKIQTVPNPTGAKSSVLHVVSCTLSTACTAVGRYDNSGGVFDTLAERWNGTEWKAQTTPNPAGAKESLLKGVSCISSIACIADGYYENSESVTMSLAESWNGSEWVIQTTPNPTGAKSTHLQGLACTSSTACEAGGQYVNSEGGELALAESWNGTEWKLQSVPNPSGATESFLDGVSCFSATDCVASGSYKNSLGVWDTLAEHWNGVEWKAPATPNPAGALSSALEGTACPSAAVCLATGEYENSEERDEVVAERSS